MSFLTARLSCMNFLLAATPNLVHVPTFFFVCFPFLLSAPKHKPDCHPIEDVSVVRDELRSVTDWKTLGEELKVPHEVLENIDSNNPKAERKLVETIRAWFNFMEKPCWEMVVKALKRMLLKKLASEVAGRHGVDYNEA